MNSCDNHYVCLYCHAAKEQTVQPMQKHRPPNALITLKHSYSSFLHSGMAAFCSQCVEKLL